MTDGLSPLDGHLTGLAGALVPYRAAAARLLPRWGSELAWTLGRGGRLLVAGNGGSAAEAQHLAAELVGKLRDDRRPLSAIALCADSSAVTAIGNDYGFEQMFARQVRGHGRAGDILIVLSTSGRSPNVIAAAAAAREVGMRTWAMTGPAPNPLAECCDETLACPAADPQVVQELHLISVHVMCEHVDRALPRVLAAEDADGVVPGAAADVDDAVAVGDLVAAARAVHGPARTAAAWSEPLRGPEGTRLGLVRGATPGRQNRAGTGHAGANGQVGGNGHAGGNGYAGGSGAGALP